MKKLIKSLLSSLSESKKMMIAQHLISELSAENKARLGKQNLEFSLQQLKKLGYQPEHVIDIGAHNGDWTLEVMKTFPDAHYHLFEPLPHKKQILTDRFDGKKVNLHHVLLGNEKKENVPFYSMESGSSVMSELTSFEREVLQLEMHPLDELLDSQITSNNTLFKIDVQGFELEVFKGAHETLKKSEVICIEISLLNYNEGAPLVDEIITSLKNYGFVPFDFVGFFRKNTDHGLIQADMLFIKEDSAIRKKINDFKSADFQVVKF